MKRGLSVPINLVTASDTGGRGQEPPGEQEAAHGQADPLEGAVRGLFTELPPTQAAPFHAQGKKELCARGERAGD